MPYPYLWEKTLKPMDSRCKHYLLPPGETFISSNLKKTIKVRRDVIVYSRFYIFLFLKFISLHKITQVLKINFIISRTRILSPQWQVQVLHGVAVSHGVGDLVHHVKPAVGKFSRLVTVTTHHRTQPRLPDLVELGQGEPHIPVSALIPIPGQEDIIKICQ